MVIQDKRLQIIKLFISICLLFVLSNCQGNTNSQVAESKNQPVLIKSDTLKNQFNQFKAFVTNGKKKEVKAFFTFPIKNKELWYKVVDDEEIERVNVDKPFNEKDFDKYFDKIFTQSFKECLSDIDTHELFKDGIFNTKWVVSKENDYLVKSQIKVTYSNGELKLIFNSVVRDKADKFESEHTEIYSFKMVDNNLKLISLDIAG